MNSGLPTLAPAIPDAAPPNPSPGNSAAPKSRFLLLCLASLGIVYGDIGTSPLYALRECFYGEHALPPTPANVLGVLSLILWSLILIISVKYLILILRADNRGEGGILALATLVSDVVGRRGKFLLLLGLFGAALLYADGMITPAISVLSAVEGLARRHAALRSLRGPGCGRDPGRAFHFSITRHDRSRPCFWTRDHSLVPRARASRDPPNRARAGGAGRNQSAPRRFNFSPGTAGRVSLSSAQFFSQ